MKENIISRKLLYFKNNKGKNKKLINDFILKIFCINHNTLALLYSLYSFHLIIIFVIIVFVPVHLSINIQFRHLNYDNKITIIVKGSGNQSILGDNFYNLHLPTQIYINGDLQSTRENNYNLGKVTNNITMIWEEQIENCSYMFQVYLML